MQSPQEGDWPWERQASQPPCRSHCCPSVEPSSLQEARVLAVASAADAFKDTINVDQGPPSALALRPSVSWRPRSCARRSLAAAPRTRWPRRSCEFILAQGKASARAAHSPLPLRTSSTKPSLQDRKHL
uniref:Uncharacterized protein n=1 Tax=Molossus molossus TaxID=27622 RepID=A0A7J8FZJ1_MOLMO|nr:hypothetical protein HJG59_008212 [Molossus molossus]